MPELRDFITFLLAYRELYFIIAFLNRICFCCFSVAFNVQMTDFFPTKLSQIFNFLFLSLPFFIPPAPTALVYLF